MACQYKDKSLTEIKPNFLYSREERRAEIMKKELTLGVLLTLPTTIFKRMAHELWEGERARMELLIDGPRMLQNLRRKMGLSMREFAGFLGKPGSFPTISKTESGKTPFTKPLLFLILRKLGEAEREIRSFPSDKEVEETRENLSKILEVYKKRRKEGEKWKKFKQSATTFSESTQGKPGQDQKGSGLDARS